MASLFVTERWRWSFAPAVINDLWNFCATCLLVLDAIFSHLCNQFSNFLPLLRRQLLNPVPFRAYS